MKYVSVHFTILLLIVLSSCARIQNPSNYQAVDGADSKAALEEKLPSDPEVIKGTLKNGLTYYIRKNGKPENRAELRLVVNAGSILEDDDQSGLAHFVEHMAFNGTEHFRKHELVNYLESIGMRFGADVNASTSYDETVYMLQVPTDDTRVMETAFQILEDWAHAISFEDEEIDRERGVIVEEWRLRRGAEARMREKQLPVIFRDSRYADRPAIGKKEVLESFGHDALRRFYRDWYRPELMAVVAVGDFDAERVKTLVQEHFGSLKPSGENSRPRPMFSVPDHKGTLYSIASDPETTKTTVGVYYKLPPSSSGSVRDLRRQIIESLYTSMFNQRLFERSRSQDAPFLSAYSRKSQFVRPRNMYTLSAMVKPNEAERGLEALLAEAKRVQQYGFTQEELDQEKKVLMRSIDQVFQERDKIPSSELASDCIENFLDEEPLPPLAYEYEMYKKYVPEITLKDVNGIAKAWIKDENRLVLASSPEKDGIRIPTPRQLASVMESAATTSVKPYCASNTCAPLLKSAPQPSPITEEKHVEEVGVTEWKLANGVRVILRPTDFKNDEILFTAFSPGGTSLVSEPNLIAAETATAVISECGLGELDKVQLQKLLADKSVSVRPHMDCLTEGMSGNASSKDMESLFQLIYLYFTSPREDSSAFEAYRARMESTYELRGTNPETAFRDAVTAAITQNNPRYKPYTTETMEQMDLAKSLEIYRNRFADASDFTFVFVGSFDTGSIRPMIETYLGGLPSLERKETWRDVTYQCPIGVVEKAVKKGVEPKSLNSIVFTGSFDWSRENRYLVNSMLDVVRMRLRERIREDLGGTYGVGVQSDLTHYPNGRYEITVSFGCQPDRVEELTKAIFDEIDQMKTHGTTMDYLNKVKEMHLRDYETNLRDNNYWLSVLESKYFNGEDPRDIMRFKELVDKLTLQDIQTTVQQYLRNDNYVRVVLYPES